MTEYELHTQGACRCLTPDYDGRDPMRNHPHSNGTDTSMNITRYGLGREYAGNTGSPAITEQADGAYVSLADHVALVNELQAELVGLERIAAAQTVTIAELRAAQPSARTPWTLTYPQIKALAAELVKAAETMGSEAHDPEYEGEELVLEVRQPGTVSNDDDSVNEKPLLAISLFDYPEEGVYPIDPTDCKPVPQSPASAQPASVTVSDARSSPHPTSSRSDAAGDQAMKTYSVIMNRCGCHPETCCCDDYAVVDERGKKYTTCFRKSEADDIAQLLNAKAKAKPAKQDADKVDACELFKRMACIADDEKCIEMLATALATVKPDPAMAGDELSLIEQLRGYAADNGYSHNDYADIMRAAADALERVEPASGENARDAARWRHAVSNWKVLKVEVFPGGCMAGVNGIPWHTLVDQADAAMKQGGQS